VQSFPVAIDDHPYLVDLSFSRGHPLGYRRESAGTVSDQQDKTDLVSEQTLARDDLWRRSQETWEAGAGQSVLDRKESDARRFRTSKGVNPWGRWELSLLPDTTSKRATANTNLQLLVVGTYLYLSDGNEVYWTQDLTTWTAANIRAGETAQAVLSMATDGKRVYAALAGSNGIHVTNRGATTSTHYSSVQADRLGYVKGRLMASALFHLYNITSGSTQVELTPATFNDDFSWDAFGDGPGSIYCAGHAGDKSKIYRVAITPEGTNLGAPVIAGELPDGEICRALDSYLGTILVGTDKGFRLGMADGGFATIGPLIPTPLAVWAFEPQDRFVWFSWSNFDSVSSGLGRADLMTFTLPLTPAYASDLMATAQGAVTGVVTFTGLRVFAVSGVGVYAETTSLVASGNLDSGFITYGVPDAKVALAAELRHQALDGSVELQLSADGGSFDSAAVSDGTGTTSPGFVKLAPVSADSTLEARLVLARSSSDATKGPKLASYTVLSQPTPRKAEIVTVPLLLHEQVIDDTEAVHRMDTAAEFDFLKGRERSGQPVTYREGSRTYNAILEEVSFLPHRRNSKFFDGLAVLRLKVYA
jgi:hypothetical protein